MSPGDGTPTSPNGGRVTCMGIRDGVPVGDWFRGLEVLLWAGVVGVDVAGMPHRIAHSPTRRASTKENARTHKQGNENSLVATPRVRWTESAHEASAAEA